MSTEQKVIGGISLLSIVILVGGVFFLSASSSPSTSSNSNINSATSVPESDIVARNGMHWHPKLSIYIKGEKQPFTNGIGLNGAVHNPIHTHDDADKDIVHMEFQGVVTKEDTKLASFFKIWGKKFSSTQIFDKKNGEEGTVKMTVNGKGNTQFENYQMRDGDMIEIKYE
ncbi:MAG TPA: hypothetical protein PKA38_05295 [Candidatus Levybacteria bacterium]|nr:hypothetical protein [Candidatus Levybacteria bacterium]